MKEIGKLLELLNEYQNKYIPDYPIRASEETINSGREILISKRYGFIKWLVENDKIDLEKLPKHLQWEGVNTDIKGEELVIMVLSIQDEPIRFLCEIIK